MNENNVRIVVTGIGFYTSLGYKSDNLWQALQKSYVDPEKWLGNICGDKLVYKIEDLNSVDNIIKDRKIKRLNTFSKWLCAAAKLALEDSKLCNDEGEFYYDVSRAGSIVTTVHGPMDVTYSYLDDLYTSGPVAARPLLFQQTVNNVACGQMAIQNKLKGVSSTLIGSSSIGYAIELMKKNATDVVFAGGIEEINDYMIKGYEQRSLLNRRNNNGYSLPWSEEVTGIISGEGAGVIILETYEHAKRRNAKIYAEIIAEYSVTDEKFCKFYDEFDEVKSTGIARAMNGALKNGNIEPKYIDCISIASNSIKKIDSIEQKAIKGIFGERKDIGYIASKAIFGETLGASEILSVIAALVSLEKGSIPGLKYLQNNLSFEKKYVYGTCMINSIFSGGCVNSIVLKKGN